MHISVSRSSPAALRLSLRGAGSHQIGSASPISPKTNSKRSLGDDTVKPATAGILGARRRTKTKNPSAIWLWGRLFDFERNGLLDTDPEDVMETIMRVAAYPCPQYARQVVEITGAPGRIRTCDLCLRRATLYPA